MNSSTLLIIFISFTILYLLQYRKNVIIKNRIAIRKRNSEEKQKMVEIAKKFIGKQCIIESFDNRNQYIGVIQEVTNGAIYILNNGKAEAINLDFVIRIREFPKKKNGKNKAIVL